ncbi:4Fe-4S dicluster domain-containing protein [Candidatus Poribacteria bacterium]|nr:4Fe-4S dicluster domain-containing protein [Candidatus Poribacteria bacterium]
MTDGKSTPQLEWERSWQKLPRGGSIPVGGTSRAYLTGGWRSSKPVWDASACSHCLLCWVYCPDSAILLDGVKMVGISYDYCKGCGVCVHECPTEGALAMVQDDGPDA